jgi:S-adenosylmethionine-diacylgycerolhomoserine-N-methlytransferase
MPAYSSELDVSVSGTNDATGRMDRMYRWQRHIYNATRRYYLLGRDRMIGNLQPTPGASVLEIGCGTGRNLMQAARLYPNTRFFGIDVSTEMLKSSMTAITRNDLGDRIRVAHGDGTSFDPQSLFGVSSFDHVMISYSLSMIPDWRRVLDAAAICLKSGGRLHVVDFGNQERLPRTMRKTLLWWLAMFDVTPRADMEPVLSEMAKKYSAVLHFERPFRGYAQHAVMAFPAERKLP